jgi:hypothetical protein
LDEIKFDGSFDITPYLVEEFGFRKINYKCLPTPPDYGPFIKVRLFFFKNKKSI